MKKILFLIAMVSYITSAQNISYPYLDVIQVPDAWLITQGDPDVVVAVMGFGVDINHPDLDDNIFINEQDPINGIDDDQNGYVDDYNGWNSLNNNSNVLPSQPHNDHETRIAGIIAAEYNEQEEIIGIAPNCKILPIKFYYQIPTPYAISNSLAAGFLYIKNLQLQYPDKKFVVNLSYAFFPGYLNEAVVTSAITECADVGISIFCSAGNDDDEPVLYPANLPNTICIAELLGTQFSILGQSCYGPEINFSAPGRVPKTTGNTNYYTYREFHGTSCATAIACGVGALVLSIEKNLVLEELNYVLEETADELPFDPLEIGSGRVNALAALNFNIGVTFNNDVENISSSYGELFINDVLH